MIHALIARLYAGVVTATAMGMAAVAALDRGGTWMDRALLVTLSLTICLGTHLIPALSRRRVAWLLWAGCLTGTVYGHTTFFVNSGIRAGHVRAQDAAQVIGAERQLEVVREALADIKARPVATVASELAGTRRWSRRQALEMELAEARRAAQFRDDLVRLSATAAGAEVAAAENPVTRVVAGVTGGNASSIDLAIGIGLSILLEQVGALLWWEVLRRPDGSDSRAVVSADPISELQEAVRTGRCKPTVAGIREFVGCGQARAMHLRRQLIGQNESTNTVTMAGADLETQKI